MLRSGLRRGHKMKKNNRLAIEGIDDKEFKSLTEVLKYLTANIPSISIHLQRAAEVSNEFNDKLEKISELLEEETP
jgi:ABC-type transporter Mla subunit MlaD